MQASDMAPGAPPVVVINERLAAAGWPGENPVGKRLSTWTGCCRRAGMARGHRRRRRRQEPGSRHSAVPPSCFSSRHAAAAACLGLVPAQHGARRAHQQQSGRAGGGALRRAVRVCRFVAAVVRDADHGRGRRRRWGAATRFSTSLLLLLAVIGLLLAAIGIYGVIAYFVTQRTPEIGLRLALGASRRNVLMMVLRHGEIALAVTGIVIGVGRCARAHAHADDACCSR